MRSIRIGRRVSVVLLLAAVTWGARCQPVLAPSVVAVRPGMGQERVSTGTSIEIDFDQAVDPASFTPSDAAVSAPSGSLAGSWSFQQNQHRAIFRSTAPLPGGETIRVDLSASIRATTGATLAAPWTSAFRTAGGPTLRAGVSSVDITPPVGVPLSGYGGGDRRLLVPDLASGNLHQFMAPSTGVRDPLTAKALVLDDGVDRIAILKLDLIGILPEAVEEVARRTVGRTGIPRERIFACATHTHSGPGALTHSVLWQLFTMDIFQESVYEALVTNASRALIEANDRLAPARLGIGRGAVQGLQVNRRGHPGRFDPDLAVIRVDRTDGRPLAVLFNLALHPICLEDDSMVISADWPGRAERSIEAQVPGATAMFINAAEGDVRPNKFGSAGVDQIGDAVARHAIDVWKNTAVKSQVDLAAGYEDLTFPTTSLHYHCDQPINHHDSRKAPIDYCMIYKAFQNKELRIDHDLSPILPSTWPIRAFRIDDTAIVTFPGEPITAVGRMGRARALSVGYRDALVFGLCGGHAGYITDPAEFDEGGYEAVLNFHGRNEGTLMVDTLERILRRIR